MKAIRLYGQSGPDQIVFEDAPQPQPGVGEVLIRVHATSVMWQEPTWSETWKTPAGSVSIPYQVMMFLARSLNWGPASLV